MLSHRQQMLQRLTTPRMRLAQDLKVSDTIQQQKNRRKERKKKNKAKKDR
jgi:hypothetical protein